MMSQNPQRRYKRWLPAGGVLSAALILSPAWAGGGEEGLSRLSYSADITIETGSSGVFLTPGQVVVADLQQGGVSAVDLGELPAGVNVDGFHQRAGGVVLFSVDVATTLAGQGFHPADVIAFDGSTYQRVFAAADRGIAGGVNVDAVTLLDNELVLSFDTAITLGSLTVADEDLVRVSGNRYILHFDGSAAGLAPAVAVDAAEVLADNRLLLSFDQFGEIAGIVFADEDVLEYDPAARRWRVVFDGSAATGAWLAADLNAVAAVVSGAGGESIFSDHFEATDQE